MEDARKGANARLTIDLQRQIITRPDGQELAFKVDAFQRDCLLKGLDEIGMTMQKDKAISSYEQKRRQSQPWL